MAVQTKAKVTTGKKSPSQLRGRVLGALPSLLAKMSLQEIKAAFLLLLAWIPSRFVKPRASQLWLICERKDNAEDNGWIFYQWLKRQHPEQAARFILDKHADNYDTCDPTMIAWGSFKHYVYYLAAGKHVKSMITDPVPSPRVCDYYEAIFHKHVDIVYLKHGIAHNGSEYHSYAKLRARLFICGAKPEYDYFVANAGYPAGYVQYTGLARYDDLLAHRSDQHFILIIPTWRRYLKLFDNTPAQNEALFANSRWYHAYLSLLNNQQFIDFATQHGYRIKFCLHAEFRAYSHLFAGKIAPEVELVGDDEKIHDLLMGMSLMITDYSSVLFDAAYMEKPVIFYHFDEQEYRQKHFSKGFYDYQRDAVGPIATTEQQLIQHLADLHSDGHFVLQPQYAEQVNRLFQYRDTNNCERIYRAIQAIG